MKTPPRIRDPKLMGAVDARDIVPVHDVHGGLTIYDQGRPTHYLLAGEWYSARSEPRRSGSHDVIAQGGCHDRRRGSAPDPP